MTSRWIRSTQNERKGLLTIAIAILYPAIMNINGMCNGVQTIKYKARPATTLLLVGTKENSGTASIKKAAW